MFVDLESCVFAIVVVVLLCLISFVMGGRIAAVRVPGKLTLEERKRAPPMASFKHKDKRWVASTSAGLLKWRAPGMLALRQPGV